MRMPFINKAARELHKRGLLDEEQYRRYFRRITAGLLFEALLAGVALYLAIAYYGHQHWSFIAIPLGTAILLCGVMRIFKVENDKLAWLYSMGVIKQSTL